MFCGRILLLHLNYCGHESCATQSDLFNAHASQRLLFLGLQVRKLLWLALLSLIDGFLVGVNACHGLKVPSLMNLAAVILDQVAKVAWRIGDVGMGPGDRWVVLVIRKEGKEDANDSAPTDIRGRMSVILNA